MLATPQDRTCIVELIELAPDLALVLVKLQ